MLVFLAVQWSGVRGLSYFLHLNSPITPAPTESERDCDVCMFFFFSFLLGLDAQEPVLSAQSCVVRVPGACPRQGYSCPRSWSGSSASCDDIMAILARAAVQDAQ